MRCERHEILRQYGGQDEQRLHRREGASIASLSLSHTPHPPQLARGGVPCPFFGWESSCPSPVRVLCMVSDTEVKEVRRGEGWVGGADPMCMPEIEKVHLWACPRLRQCLHMQLTKRASIAQVWMCARFCPNHAKAEIEETKNIQRLSMKPALA